MDIELFYEQKGNGFPLVLLHGNGEDHSYFVNQIDYFSKKYRVIAIDTRGHGKSPRGNGVFSISRFANDLYEFFCEKGINKAHILGFSDGANIALEFALKHPEMIEKLILNGGNLCPAGIKRSTQFPIELGYKISGFFAKKSADALKNHEMLALMVNEPDILPESLISVTAPTLVIVGTNDMVKHKHSELIAKSIKNAELAIIKGNHFIANKKPREFNSAVEKFLLK